MRYKLILSYDGTGYSGYQKQPHQNTIQDKLEQALKKMTDQNIDTFAASRTDSGVHALYQVIHFDFDASIAPDKWIEGLNKRLPDDIKVLKISRTKDNFHARYDSKAKTYIYKIGTKPLNPLDGRYQVYVPNLNIGHMRIAMQDVIGTHDFRAFSKLDLENQKDPVKTIYEFTVKPYKQGYVFKIKGNHFLRYMVRSIMGNLIDIGLNRKPVDHIKRLLETKDRKLTAKTADAKGLILYHIYY